MAPYDHNASLGTSIALPILAVIATALRFFIRLRVRRTYVGIDDWLCLGAVVLVCGHGVIGSLSTIFGEQSGVNIALTSQSRILFQQRVIRATVILEKVTYTTIKLSVLFLYRRIFYPNVTFRKFNNALIALIILWGLIFLTLECAVCVAGDYSKVDCVAQEWVLVWFAITEVVGDGMILAMPWPCVRVLQMREREKWAVRGAFALGGLSTVFGIIRLGYVAQRFYDFFHPRTIDNLAAGPGFWTMVQMSVGVIAACLPTFGPLIRKVPRLTTQKSHNSVHQRGLFARLQGERINQARDRSDTFEEIGSGDGFDAVHLNGKGTMKGHVEEHEMEEGSHGSMAALPRLEELESC